MRSVGTGSMVAICGLLVICLNVRADSRPVDLHDLARLATLDDVSASKPAIAQLRAAGPAGLAVLMDANAQAIRAHREGTASPDDPAWTRVASAIDAVAAQKDAWASGLYWYTDLEAAEAAARQQGKPILSLRLMGTLDSEYSCANSRFFRTVLYANAEVAKVLSNRFVLHWKSVRPVPKVTIDFGDGRIVQRTITGNSIHYILDADGQVVDAIPGLYGPRAFLRELDDAATVATEPTSMKSQSRLGEWHKWKSKQILALWQSDLKQLGAIATDQAARPGVAGGFQRRAANPPPAALAARRAVGKSAVERPLVIALSPDARVLETVSKDDVWVRLAALHADDARLDAGSRAMIAAKNPTALQAGGGTLANSKAESPLLKITHNFEHFVALDTVKNQYMFHRQIHDWLATGQLPDGKSSRDVDALNERVYADLFLTPSSDPWLGLLPADTYSALPNDGLCDPK